MVQLDYGSGAASSSSFNFFTLSQNAFTVSRSASPKLCLLETSYSPGLGWPSSKFGKQKKSISLML